MIFLSDVWEQMHHKNMAGSIKSKHKLTAVLLDPQSFKLSNLK